MLYPFGAMLNFSGVDVDGEVHEFIEAAFISDSTIDPEVSVIVILNPPTAMAIAVPSSEISLADDQQVEHWEGRRKFLREHVLPTLNRTLA